MATYYIDYDGGNDSNSGTSTGSPWKKHPYMSGFGGSYTHAAGDIFIFKGGVTWPRSCFQLRITAGGTSDSVRDYYKTDSSWYSGGSWTRPKFDFENISLGSGTSNYGIYITATNPYITFDNLECLRHRGEAVHGSCNINVAFSGTGYIIFSNCLIRDWSLPTPLTPYLGLGNMGGGIWWTAGSGLVVVSACEFHQQNSVYTSGRALQSVNVLQNSYIHHCGTGWTGGGTVRYNRFHTLGYNLADPTAHLAAIKTFVVSDIYGNTIYNLDGVCAPIELSSGFSSPSGTDRVYNNLIFDTNIQPVIWLKTDKSSYQYIHLKCWNNTVARSGGGLCIYVYDGGAGIQLASADVRNNHCISDSSNPIDVTNVASYIYSNNVSHSVSQATSFGYISASQFQPTSALSPTVDVGVDLSAYFTTDIDEKLRAAPWDVGAYEFSGSSGGGGESTGSHGIISVSAQSGSVYENEGSFFVECQRTFGNSGSVTIDYETSNITALAGINYTETTGSLTWNNSDSSSKYVEIGITDTNMSSSKSFLFSLSNPGGGALLGSQSLQNITIQGTTFSSLTFEAEEGEIQDPWAAEFSGTIGYIVSHTETIPPSETIPLASYVFNIETPGYYFVSANVKTPDAAHNSIYINIDDSNLIEGNQVWDLPVTGTSSWEGSWTNATSSWRGTGSFEQSEIPFKTWHLNSGMHTLYIGNREEYTFINYLSINLYQSTDRQNVIISPHVTPIRGIVIYPGGPPGCVVSRL